MNIESINLVILSITLIVIIWYTIETRKMRFISSNTLKELRKQLDYEKQKIKPDVIAYFDNGADFKSILLVISNEGGSIALGIKLTITPTLDLGDNIFQKYFYENASFKNGVTLKANCKYVIRVGNTVKASPMYRENKLPSKYNVNIAYTDISGKSHFKEYELPIDQFFYRIDPDDDSKIERALSSIDQSLKVISDKITDRD